MSGSVSNGTIDQTWEEHSLQDGQFRTSCRSSVIRQFLKQFVFNNAATRIVGTRGTSGLWKQGCFEFTFRFSFWWEGDVSSCSVFLSTHFLEPVCTCPNGLTTTATSLQCFLHVVLRKAEFQTRADLSSKNFV